MIRDIIKKGYHIPHDIAFDTIKWNPFFPKEKNSESIKFGYISMEHLNTPLLDDELVNAFESLGIEVEDFYIDIEEAICKII